MSAAEQQVIDRDRVAAIRFLRHVEFHPTATSTNDLALRAAADPALPVPALFWAERQTAGRGRRANAWWSAPGALLFSFVLDLPARAADDPARPSRLSLTTATAVSDAMVRSAPAARVRVKWPNDVLLDGRKVAGILLESPNLRRPGPRRMVVGVGVNVNNSIAEAPAGVRQRAAALCDVTGEPHDLTEVLVQVLDACKRRFRQWWRRDPSLARAWRLRCALKDRPVQVEIGQRTLLGMCRGVDVDGALVVEAHGRLHRLFSGSVR